MRKVGKTLIHILLALILVCQSVQAQANSSKIGESEYFEFYSNFWFNLHHFVYQEALYQKVGTKTILSKEESKLLSSGQKSIFESVVEYYKVNLLDEDLRMSDFMTDFKHWVTDTQTGFAFKEVPDQFQALCKELKKISSIYQDLFWNNHQKYNNQTLNENINLIKTIEKSVVEKLSNQTRERWQRKKIRVDITAYAKATPRNLRDRPYTTTYPTHIVMNSKTADGTPGNWLELLFHEASHHLIGSSTGFVGGTIQDVARSLQTQSPRSLWHAYLFYFSGFYVKEAIEQKGINNYELYMKRNQVFARYIPHLEKFLPLYLKGEKSLADVTRDIILKINKP